MTSDEEITVVQKSHQVIPTMKTIYSFGVCSRNESYALRFDHEKFERDANGLLTSAIVGWFASIHGLIWLMVANRLGWFQYHQFYIIVNEMLAEFLCSLFWAFSATRMLLVTPFPCEQDQSVIPITVDSGVRLEIALCTLIHLPANILYTCTQKAALFVAVDRVYNLLFPIRWIKAGVFYRFALIAVAWLWAIAQEFSWLVVYSIPYPLNDCVGGPEVAPGYSYAAACNYLSHTGNALFTLGDMAKPCCFMTELQCFRHTSAIDKNTYYWIYYSTTVLDGVTDALILIFYVCIPFLAVGYCRRVLCGNPNVKIYWSGLEEQEKKMLIRVRLVTFVTLLVYIPTTFAASVTNLLLNANFGMNLFVGYAMSLCFLYGVLSIYLFAWKDERFRQELIALGKSVVDKCGKSKDTGPVVSQPAVDEG